MALQGTQLDVLNAIADLQDSPSIEKVEDTWIAEEVELEVNAVQNVLHSLVQDGYVDLEEVEKLSGKGYMVSLTSKSRALVEWTKLHERGL